MITRRVHHVSFPVTDLERSRRFYQDVLGLQPIPRPDLGVAGIWLRAADTEIHLIVTPAGVDVGRRPPALTPLAAHTAFAVDDYEKTLSVLKQRGRKVLETSPEVGQMWVQDPDGNVIELIVPRREPR